MGKRLWNLVLMLAFVSAVYLVVVSPHAAQLRQDARAASQWNHKKQPSPADLAKLSARAQWMVHAQCYNEGGSPIAPRNCYAEGASWMLTEAKEQESTRDMAYLGLAVVAGLAVLTLVVNRRKPAFEP